MYTIVLVVQVTVDKAACARVLLYNIVGCAGDCGRGSVRTGARDMCPSGVGMCGGRGGVQPGVLSANQC